MTNPQTTILNHPDDCICVHCECDRKTLAAPKWKNSRQVKLRRDLKAIERAINRFVPDDYRPYGTKNAYTRLLNGLMRLEDFVDGK